MSNTMAACWDQEKEKGETEIEATKQDPQEEQPEAEKIPSITFFDL